MSYDPVELIVLRTHPTHVVGWDPGDINRDPCRLVYRKPGLDLSCVPGYRLTIEKEKVWRHKGRDFLAGTLLHVGFSLRALSLAKFPLPTFESQGLFVPGSCSDAMAGAITAPTHLDALFFCNEVLEEYPGCLSAHALAGEKLDKLGQPTRALMHLTAAIRLALGAMVEPGCEPGRFRLRENLHERLVIGSLCLRSRFFLALGRDSEAGSDWRRALTWDPEGVVTEAYGDLRARFGKDIGDE